MSERILVAGLGHVLMGDDAIGPYCAKRLSEGYWFPKNVEIADLGTPGPGLTVHLSNADRVLVIDALRGVLHGTIAAYDDAAIVGARRETGVETHSLALAEAIQIARLACDRPRDVRLVGLAGTIFDHGTALSPEVRARIPWLIERVLEELSTWGVEWERRRESNRHLPGGKKRQEFWEREHGHVSTAREASSSASRIRSPALTIW
jgi:hydrogenase maturation protease